MLRAVHNAGYMLKSSVPNDRLLLICFWYKRTVHHHFLLLLLGSVAGRVAAAALSTLWLPILADPLNLNLFPCCNAICRNPVDTILIGLTSMRSSLIVLALGLGLFALAQVSVCCMEICVAEGHSTEQLYVCRKRRRVCATLCVSEEPGSASG